MLILDIDNQFFKSEKEFINIDSLLCSKKINIILNNNEKSEITKIKFESCPKILIILLQLKASHNFNIYSNEKIDIKDLIINKNKNISKYELISAIGNLNSCYRVYCKYLTEAKIWFDFTEIDSGQNIKTIKSVKEIRKLENPYLLIYQQCQNN